MSRLCPARALVGATALTFAFACGGAPSPPAGEEQAREEVVVANTPAALPAEPARVSAKPTARDAVAHLPADCDAAAVLDLARLRTQPAVAKELVPRLERLLTVASKSAETERMQLFVKESGLELRELRSVAMCAQTKARKEPLITFWLDAGLRPGKLIPALVNSLSPDEPEVNVTENGAQFVGNGEIAFAQYSDGIVGFGESLETLRRSINAGTSASVYRFDRSKDLAFFIAKDLIESGFLPGLSEKAADLFGGVGEVVGTADLSTGKFQLTVQASSPDEAKVLNAVATLGKDAALKDPRLWSCPDLVDRFDCLI